MQAFSLIPYGMGKLLKLMRPNVSRIQTTKIKMVEVNGIEPMTFPLVKRDALSDPIQTTKIKWWR